MKFSKLSVYLVTPITVGVLLASSAQAASRLSNLVDLDGDGVISATEIEQAREKHKSALLEQYDTDGDGTLSREERRALRSDRRDEMLANFDADGDGKLSKEEKRTARADAREKLEAQLDVNQDGVLSDAESAGMEEVREQRKNDRDEHRGKGKKGGKHRNG